MSASGEKADTKAVDTKKQAVVDPKAKKTEAPKKVDAKKSVEAPKKAEAPKKTETKKV